MSNWQTPKTDWTPVDGVKNSDMNRIEGNAAYLNAARDLDKQSYMKNDFAGKIAGSVVDNPNIAAKSSSTSLLIPTDSNWSEFVQADYVNLQTQDSNCVSVSTNVNGARAQEKISINIIANVEAKYGTIPGSTTSEKVNWLKNNIDSIICNAWIFGSCPSGNKAYLSFYNIGKGGVYPGFGLTNSTPDIQKLTAKMTFDGQFGSYGFMQDCINNNGYVYFIAYTDASDGTTPSVINIDYVDIEVTFKDIFARLLLEANRLNTHVADNSKQIPHLGTTTNLANDTYAITTAETINVNEKFTIKFNVASVSTPTLSINNGTACAIKKANGNAAKLYASVYTLFWDGTSFILLGEGGEYGTATPADVLNTKTLGTEYDGVQQGTLDLSNLIPSNIKDQVNINGVIGNVSIASLGGKQIATGNGSVASSSTDIHSGLPFTPSTIIIVGSYAPWSTLRVKCSLGNWSARVASTGSNYVDSTTNSGISIIDHGFTYYPGVSSAVNYNWIAYS